MVEIEVLGWDLALEAGFIAAFILPFPAVEDLFVFEPFRARFEVKEAESSTSISSSSIGVVSGLKSFSS